VGEVEQGLCSLMIGAISVGDRTGSRGGKVLLFSAFIAPCGGTWEQSGPKRYAFVRVI
jgi:hypothetical protein